IGKCVLLVHRNLLPSQPSNSPDQAEGRHGRGLGWSGPFGASAVYRRRKAKVVLAPLGGPSTPQPRSGATNYRLGYRDCPLHHLFGAELFGPFLVGGPRFVGSAAPTIEIRQFGRIGNGNLLSG